MTISNPDNQFRVVAVFWMGNYKGEQPLYSATQSNLLGALEMIRAFEAGPLKSHVRSYKVHENMNTFFNGAPTWKELDYFKQAMADWDAYQEAERQKKIQDHRAREHHRRLREQEGAISAASQVPPGTAHSHPSGRKRSGSWTATHGRCFDHERRLQPPDRHALRGVSVLRLEHLHGTHVDVRPMSVHRVMSTDHDDLAYGCEESIPPCTASAMSEANNLTTTESEFCRLGFCFDCGDLLDEHDLGREAAVPVHVLCSPCRRIAPTHLINGTKAVVFADLRRRLKMLEQPVSRSGQKPINMDEERRKRRGA